MAVFTVSLQQASGVGDVSLGDGTTLATLAVSAGRGPKGDGFTGGTYDAGTGKVTFTSNDGIGFETGDLRGDLTEPGPIGSVTPNTGAFTSLSTTGNAVIGGDLTVEGTTTTVDSTTVAVGDKNIELAKDATTPAEADGGGITLTGASATITYSSANDYWALNKGLNVSGNVSLSGTVDGRDVAADGSKLDGIESGATADQTAGEIKTAYESNADTNAFTDSEQSKLAGIEAGADVTDTTNVTAAGALMDSELTSEASVKALDQGVATTDSPDFAGLTVSGSTSLDSLSVDTDTLYVDSANNRVGIGTSSPTHPLEVTGESILVGSSFTSGGGSPELIFTTDASSGRGAKIAKQSDSPFNLTITASTSTSGSDQELVFETSPGSEAMRIDSSGNVGIGTSSPSATLDVNGSLSKNSGSFKIDHPIKPDTHHLVHSFVEGPQADNLYRGKVTLVDGSATVNLDEAGRMTEGTFVALNGNVQCWTTNEDGWTQVRGKVEGNTLTIEAQDPACTDEVSWLVIGERHDQHMMDTEWTDENGRVITEPAKENTK